jgi:hypothetical protein
MVTLTLLKDVASSYHLSLLQHSTVNTAKPVLNGISTVQNIVPLKPGIRLIKVYYDSHGT